MGTGSDGKGRRVRRSPSVGPWAIGALAVSTFCLGAWLAGTIAWRDESDVHCSANDYPVTLRGCVVSESDLNGVDLRRANLQGANLSGLAFNGRDLRGTHLEGANLTATRLERAQLQGAHLNGATVSGATFRGACLRGADLAGIDLTTADFAGAYFGSDPPEEVAQPGDASACED